MTKEEFIKKWVVAYESKEQQIEFANEMKADLDGLVTAENTRLRGALERYEKVSEMIITTPSKNTATKEDLKQWQYTCIQMLESLK